MSQAGALLQAQEIKKSYEVGRRRLLSAVDGVTLEVQRGETLGLVGESGCGKSTLGRLICRLEEPTSGRLTFEGVDLLALAPEELRRMRPRMQMVFQDPYSALNPHRTVAQIVGLPLRLQGVKGRAELVARVGELLELVGLDVAAAGRFPHQFSGGQRQRIGVARALASKPDLIVADEPVASLDVSIQAQILDILRGLQRRLGLTLVFISHDISVVSHISNRIAVMYLGAIVEIGPADRVIAQPLHPYTRALLAAVPRIDHGGSAEEIRLAGDPPSPTAIPPGCRFHTRCYLDQIPACREVAPELRELALGHLAACHLAGPQRPEARLPSDRTTGDD